MSQVLIAKYLADLHRLRQIGGTHRESVVREAFKDLLKSWAKQYDLTFIAEHELETKTKERRYVDGALLHTLRVPFGYWEAKDEKDDIDAEIELKFRRGYPKTNIIFEDSTQAVLIQHGQEVMRCDVDQVDDLEKLLTLFFEYERPEIEAFRNAVEQFKRDLPAVLDALRAMIEKAYDGATFRNAAESFLKHAQEAINPNLVDADVREMLIQHILTGEVFDAIFPGQPFHEDNNVARELHKLESTFFVGNTRFQTLKGLGPYYAAIRKAASEITTHHEKQTFLKSIYENFYKVYNPKAADRLGVVYTPNEVVRFMIESTDWLCEKHFGRTLLDKEVDILDPATGTGTFICELITHFSGQKQKLERKYKSELHANEVAILPYYVANLNIEATYAAVVGRYDEFPGLCFVDTLDNTHALRKHKGHMDDLFGAVSDDNVKRIRKQNSRTISVIIGNPPYNANQLNENENNKNREYPEIDKRIRDTYIAESDAQKTKLYDMYARFFRWASDRLDENGILAFISNRSFVDRRTFDGFRKVIGREFNEIRVVDLGGDVRANPKLSGTAHNVFGIQTGVAISFMIRRAKQKGCRIFYARRPEMERAEDKLSFLGSTKLSDIEFEEIKPDKNNAWINRGSDEYQSLMPLASKGVKSAQGSAPAKAVFKLFSLGISTNRDDWVYDHDAAVLENKAAELVKRYDAQERDAAFSDQIKWSETLKRRFAQFRSEPFDQARIVRASYRPFCKKFLYDSDLFIDRGGAKDEMFPIGESNRSICFSDAGSRTDYVVLAVDGLADLHFGSSIDAYQQVPQFCYQDGQRLENVTDWALAQFRKRYPVGRGKSQALDKSAIFHYVYGVLHNPGYREAYALNLRQEFPRIPFYDDFWLWEKLGSKLLDLHLGHESLEPWPLQRIDIVDDKSKAAGLPPKCLLKADAETGSIILDSESRLQGIPAAAWKYRLGSRSAIDWVLDQYRERKPKDPVIAKNFDAYRFGKHKEEVISLLGKVTQVSVQTAAILAEMKQYSKSDE